MYKSFRETVGKNIKKYRLKAKLKLCDISLITNISTGYLFKIESGKSNCYLSTIIKIAEALNISLYDLFDD